MNNNELACCIVGDMLEMGAIKFNFIDPFIWTSGIKSPIYCDNRASLSNIDLRNKIKEAYIKIAESEFTDIEVIAGVATGGIPQGVMIADRLNLPFVYVRREAKEYGLGNTVEGYFEPQQKVLIIEDLVSTGGSSIKALNALKEKGADVLGMVAAFSYELPVAYETFNKNNCKLFTITTFSVIKDVALEKGYLSEEELIKLNQWHKNPQEYKW